MVKCLFADRLGRKTMREIERPLPLYYTLANLGLPAVAFLDQTFYEQNYLDRMIKDQTRLFRLTQDLDSLARYEEL